MTASTWVLILTMSSQGGAPVAIPGYTQQQCEAAKQVIREQWKADGTVPRGAICVPEPRGEQLR